MVAMNVWPTDAADGSVSSEARWRKMARYWVSTGVCAGQGADMLPTLAFPNLTVKAGACWVDGHYCELPGDQVLAVTANGLCVVRFDPAANTAQLLYLDGVSTPSQSPTGVYEIPIAKITGSTLADWRSLVGAGNPLYGFSLRRSVNEAARGTLQSFQIGFDTCVQNSGFLGPLAPGPMAAQAIFTVPQGGGGLYQLNAGAYWASNLVGIGLSITVNGVAVVSNMILGGQYAQSYEIGRAWRLVPGDQIAATVYNGSTGNLTVTAFAGSPYTAALPYLNAWKIAQ